MHKKLCVIAGLWYVFYDNGTRRDEYENITQVFFCTDINHSTFYCLHTHTHTKQAICSVKWPRVLKHLRIPHARNPEKKLVTRILAWPSCLTNKSCLLMQKYTGIDIVPAMTDISYNARRFELLKAYNFSESGCLRHQAWRGWGEPILTGLLTNKEPILTGLLTNKEPILTGLLTNSWQAC